MIKKGKLFGKDKDSGRGGSGVDDGGGDSARRVRGLVRANLLHAYEDVKVMRRLFFYAGPIACVLMGLEGALDLPWFMDVALITLVAAALTMQNEWSSLAATLLRLGAGHFVVNLNTQRQGDKPFVLYDNHRDPDCRVVREAISMLGLDVEVRSGSVEACGFVACTFIAELALCALLFLLD